MEPQPPDAGGAGGAADPARSLVAPQAPASAVDSLTGALLPLAETAAATAPAPAAPSSASDQAAAGAPTVASDPAAASDQASASDPAAPPAATPAPLTRLGQLEAQHPPGPDGPLSLPGLALPAPTAVAVPPGPSPLPMPLDAEPTLLTIAGRRYAVADLPPDARALLDGVRLADLLLAQKGETCQLLRRGLEALERQLSQRLQAVQPLPALVAAPLPSLPGHGGNA